MSFWRVSILTLFPLLPAHAQHAPGEITDEQLIAYRLSVKHACMNGELRGRGGTEEQIEGYCACMINVLEST